MLGRVQSVRMLGSKLMFLDIERDAQRLQIMIEVKKLEDYENVLDAFKAFKKVVGRGDWVGRSLRSLSNARGSLTLL